MGPAMGLARGHQGPNLKRCSARQDRFPAAQEWKEPGNRADRLGALRGSFTGLSYALGIGACFFCPCAWHWPRRPQACVMAGPQRAGFWGGPGLFHCASSQGRSLRTSSGRPRRSGGRQPNDRSEHAWWRGGPFADRRGKGGCPAPQTRQGQGLGSARKGPRPEVRRDCGARSSMSTAHEIGMVETDLPVFSQ
jgi:hypothetical protein